MKKILLLYILLLSSICHIKAQKDTLTLSIPEAEKIFLQKNLSLLAAKYNIDANQALIQQAKLWDNPFLSTDQNLYDQQSGFFKHNSTDGQIYLQVQQLIKTAGKRSKLTQLAVDNTELAKAQFNDVLRSLRYTLINNLLQTQYLLKAHHVYQLEISELNRLINGMKAQLDAGNISLKDFTRLKALLFGLQNDIATIESQLIPVQQEIKLLLQSNDSIFIKPDLHYKFAALTEANLPGTEFLADTAKKYRPDYLIDKLQLDYNSHNVTYQKALAKPDLTLGLSMDQRSSYAPYYVGLQIGLPIPILNRNQGAIKSAQIQVAQQQALLTQRVDRIENEVQGALSTVKFYQKLNDRQQLDFSNEYDSLFNNMVAVYKDRKVSLLEFIDFIDNYKETKLKLLSQHTSLIQSIADLNYTINKDIISIQ